MIPNDMLNLLRAIYRGQREGYLTLTAIHPDKRHATPSRHLHIRDKAAIHQGLADVLRANQQGWGAYFSVALRQQPLGRWKRGGQDDLLTLPALYADLDGKLSESLPRLRKAAMAGMPAPSVMIGSGRGLHLYWLIESTTDFVTANQVLAGLAKTLGGDDVRVTQALRLPGSHNTKPHVNRPCQLLWLVEDRRYTLNDFAAFAERQSQSASTNKRYRAPPDAINTALVDAVVDALMRDYGGFIQKNGWIGALCPCGHHHDKPGKHFAFLPDKAVAKCLGRHGQILLKDLCDHLHIDPAAYGGLYRQNSKEPVMAKKKSRKKKELILLIRIPDADSRNGKATLTIQRDELGHMSEFDYKGLTLKGNIAEAVGMALTKLVGVESAPPPEISAETPKTVSAATDTKSTEKTASEDEKSVSSELTVEGDDDPTNPTETGEKGENATENPLELPKSGVIAGVSTADAMTDTDTSEEVKSAQESPKQVSVSVASKPPDTSSTDTQQMSMF